ncbi:hypothetical protein PPECC79_7010 [Escherichia coli PCN079]|nr:hypothetical protein PPECC79_7010 [Escherichia coli PCN079]CDK50627.1 hypothetical protein [Escherichia coli IS5]
MNIETVSIIPVYHFVLLIHLVNIVYRGIFTMNINSKPPTRCMRIQYA